MHFDISLENDFMLKKLKVNYCFPFMASLEEIQYLRRNNKFGFTETSVMPTNTALPPLSDDQISTEAFRSAPVSTYS